MRLPPGFRMATRSAQAMPGSSEPVAHLVFTDGIASVSVFVEPRKPDTKAAEGPGARGFFVGVLHGGRWPPGHRRG